MKRRHPRSRQPDRRDGLTRREQGIRKVTATDHDFMQLALRIVWKIARRQRHLTCDEVRVRVPLRSLPVSPNSWAALFVNAAKAGYIRRTSANVESELASNHRRRITVWQSRLNPRKASAA